MRLGLIDYTLLFRSVFEQVVSEDSAIVLARTRVKRRLEAYLDTNSERESIPGDDHLRGIYSTLDQLGLTGRTHSGNSTGTLYGPVCRTYTDLPTMKSTRSAYCRKTTAPQITSSTCSS